MTARRILMACTHHFASPRQVGSQHLARAFARAGWDVLYVSAPLTPMHLALAGDADVRSRLGILRSGGKAHMEGRLHEIVPFALAAPDARPVLRSEAVTRLWHRTMLPGAASLAARHGFGTVDALYVDNPFQAHWFHAIRARTSVFRITDRHPAFPGWRGAAEDAARRCAARAALTVYSAHALEDYALGLGPNRAAHLPNGIDFALFDATPSARPDALGGVRGPIAIYAGALDAWLDFDLVRHVARALPDVTFVLLGPGAPHGLDGLPNVLAPGPVPHAQLPAWLHASQAGIIPFDTAGNRKLIEGVNPLKLYEYLACGLPVVSTRWTELENIGSPAALADDAHAFAAALRKAIESPPATQEHMDFARSHDWSHSFDRLCTLMGLETKIQGRPS